MVVPSGIFISFNAVQDEIESLEKDVQVFGRTNFSNLLQLYIALDPILVSADGIWSFAKFMHEPNALEDIAVTVLGIETFSKL